MACGRCGSANRPMARFCNECGSPLVRRCDACGHELSSSAKFCDECGTATGSAGAPSGPSSAAAATRKTVTFLFADLGGSTGFGERTDAERTRGVMAAYHALLQRAVDRHGGTVAKFMGDGMMATFGIPEVAEDDALRAVRAGVDIQRRFEDFAADVVAQHGETLTLRVGVNTGEVVIAEGDADLVGDALNVAARLEAACRPGHVLVGEETWRLTRAEVGYVPLGEVSVAGRSAEVGAYEVDDAASSADETITPFVGRAEEMRRLTKALDRARQERTAQLVTVLGSPGVGKTRLARELTGHAVDLLGAEAFEIRCDRGGDATFAPIAQLIRAVVATGDESADLRGRLARQFAADEPDRERLVEVLAGVVGSAAARSVEETFWAIRRLIESLGSTTPLVLVVDDIQWAEPKLLDLLEHLAEWIADAPVLLVCLARPELREVRGSLAEPSRRVVDVVSLDGLDSASTEQLAAALLGSDLLPVGLAARLPVSTEGNPLFVRELIRMLVDDRVIVRAGDGRWALTIDADAVEVPPTIQSLLAARLERLSAEQRRVLELASVIGAEFNLGALGELAGPATPTTAVLDDMRRKELVEPTGTYWGDAAVYRFHHVLIRDAAYRRLLKTTRAELHERVGEWMVRASAGLPGEHEAAIAHHFEQATRYHHELGPVGESTVDLGRRAAGLLRDAARHAMDRDDLSSARTLATRALAVLPESDASERAELLVVACECALAAGDVAAGSTTITALTALARHGDADRRLGAWAQCYAAQLVGLTDPAGLVEAEAAASEAARTLAGAGDRSGEAKAHQVRAGLLARLGRVGDAEVVLDQALAAARAVDDLSRVIAVLGAAPVAALFGPSPVARAGGRCLDVVRLLRITTASPSVEATSMRCQAVLEALRGRFDAARTMLASARTSLEELGLRHGLLETDLFAGMVELIAGEPAAAVAPLRRAYEGLGTLGVGADAGQAAALLARALLAQGDVDGADAMATSSEQLAGQNLKTAIAWRVARGEVQAARGDLDSAVASATEAVAIAASTDLTIDHADACAALAMLRRTAGDEAGASSAGDEALRLYGAKGAAVPAERLRVATQRETTSVPRDQLEDGPDANLASGFEVENAASRLGRQAFSQAEVDIRAVRGDRLALLSVLLRPDAGPEIARLLVYEIDGAGRLARAALFDTSDLQAALDDMEQRYILGEGASIADWVRLAGDHARALHRRDWDAFAELYDPAIVAIDHRQMGFPTSNAAELRERMRAIVEQVPGVVQIQRTLEVMGHATVAYIETSGASSEGTRSVWPFINVSLRAGDRLIRTERFAIEDAAAARARFEELGAAAFGGPLVENAATRALAASDELFTTSETEVIAVRGDRLALCGLVLSSGGDHDLPPLILGEVGGDGRFTRVARFDSGDLDAALDELDHWFLAGEGAEHGAVLEPLVRFRELTSVGDVDGAAAMCAEPFTLVDHRPLGWGTQDDADVTGYLGATEAVMPGRSTIVRFRAVVGRAALALLEERAPAAGAEWNTLTVSVVDAHGRIERMEMFPDDRYAEAMARLQELGAPTAKARPSVLVSSATRASDRWQELLVSGDLDELERRHTADCVVLDRRRSVAPRDHLGLVAVMERYRLTVELGAAPAPAEHLAIRGDCLVLSRWRVVADGFETEVLGLREIDEQARTCRMVAFDVDDLQGALDELEDRFIAGEGAGCEHEIRGCGDWHRALVDRDWSALRDLLSADFLLIDHRPVSYGSLDAEALLASQRMLDEQVPGYTARARRLEARNGVFFEDRLTAGTTTEGFAAEWPLLLVSSWVAGRAIRCETFAVEDEPAARARFEELASAD